MYTFNMAVHLQAQQKMDMIPRKLVLGSFSSELYIFVSYTVEPKGAWLSLLLVPIIKGKKRIYGSTTEGLN